MTTMTYEYLMSEGITMVPVVCEQCGCTGDVSDAWLEVHIGPVLCQECMEIVLHEGTCATCGCLVLVSEGWMRENPNTPVLCSHH